MEKSSFFNSVNGDRRYDATMWAAYFASFIGNGVFPNPSTNLQVVADQNMRLTVQPGSAWINGYFYINTSNLSVQLDTADGSMSRVDRIVAQWSFADRRILTKVKKGTYSSSPTTPTLQRDTAIYELCLADVQVSAGATAITQANITDQRLNTALCGVVAAVVNQIDTTAFNAQLQSWYSTFKSKSETDFTTWLNSIKAVLDETDTGTMLNMITDLVQRVDGIESAQETLANGLSAIQAQVTQQLSEAAATLNQTLQTATTQLENKLSALDGKKQNELKPCEVTLLESGWTAYDIGTDDQWQQTMDVSGWLAKDNFFATYADGYKYPWQAANISALNTTVDGKITFVCAEKPEQDVGTIITKAEVNV